MFTWTPGSCCLQCTCCFGKTGWHFQTEDENFLHLKFTAFAEVHLKCSSILPAVMYTPPEYMAFSHSQHAETPQQSKNKIKKLFLFGHGQEHLEVCFRSGQYSWSTHRPGSGWSLAAPRPWSPTAAKAHSGAVLRCLNLCRGPKWPVHQARSTGVIVKMGPADPSQFQAWFLWRAVQVTDRMLHPPRCSRSS